MAYHVSIFLENKAGNFERVTNILKYNEVNIRSISLMHTPNGWGILNLLVSDPEKAQSVLSSAGLSVALRKIFAFGMDDKPGGLDDVLVKVMKAGVNIINAYGQLVQRNEQAMLIVDVENYDEALPLLEAEGLSFLPDDIVYET